MMQSISVSTKYIHKKTINFKIDLPNTLQYMPKRQK